MSTHKHIDLICVVVMVLALVVTILFANGSALGVQTVVDEDAEQNSDTSYFTANDRAGDWDTDQAVTITLNGTGGSIQGNGAYFYDGNLVIAGAGKYVISGSLTDGSIIVDANESSKVYILLNEVEITCSDDACLRVEEADKVFLTLAEGSTNILTSGTTYSDSALADGTDGVIFAHDDLTINGSGDLTVSGGYKHGVAANDDLVITGGSLTVDAVADGIHANDSLRICDAKLTVNAGDDGLAVSNDGGFFYMESGTVSVTSGDDAIHAAGNITIDGGSLTINAGDNGIHSDTAILINNGSILIETCYEGMEAKTIEQTGGDITIYPTDDGLNANGGTSLGGFGGMGGFQGKRPDNFQMDSNTESGQQRAFHQGGRPDFNQSDTDAESDHAENDQQMEQPDFSQMDSPPQVAEPGTNDTENTAESDEEAYIRISGGTLTIINEKGRDADGLDSNGDIEISGGTIFVSLVGDGSNCAIDCASENGGVCQISGGTVIACGGSSMAEGFNSNSAQSSFLYNLTETQQAGTVITLTDESGRVLVHQEIPCSFSSVNISTGELRQGGTYNLTIGDMTEQITLADIASTFGTPQSMMGGFNDMPGGRGGYFDDNFEEDFSDGPEYGE